MQKDLSKTMGLLKMALDNIGNDPSLHDTRNHVQQAITRLENASRRDKPKTKHQQWWGDIVSGTAPISPQAAIRSLKELNAMISTEQKKINDLEKIVQEKTDKNNLLKD